MIRRQEPGHYQGARHQTDRNHGADSLSCRCFAHKLTKQFRTALVDRPTSAIAKAQTYAVVLDATRDAWHNRYSREAFYAEAGNVLRGKTWGQDG